MYHEISGIEKVLGCGGGGWEGVSRLSVKHVLSHSNESFRRGSVLCFTKILFSELLMDMMGG